MNTKNIPVPSTFLILLNPTVLLPAKKSKKYVPIAVNVDCSNPKIRIISINADINAPTIFSSKAIYYPSILGVWVG